MLKRLASIVRGVFQKVVDMIKDTFSDVKEKINTIAEDKPIIAATTAIGTVMILAHLTYVPGAYMVLIAGVIAALVVLIVFATIKVMIDRKESEVVNCGSDEPKADIFVKKTKNTTTV